MTNFETYNTIPNIDSSNNKFYFDDNDETIIIPESSYELNAIGKYLKGAIVRKLRDKHNKSLKVRAETTNVYTVNDGEYYIYDVDYGDEEGDRSILLRANENTMRSEIKCVYRVNFTKPNYIGSLLGFSASRILQPNKWYASDAPVNIINVHTIRVECNITMGAFNNGEAVRYTRYMNLHRMFHRDINCRKLQDKSFIYQ